MSWMQYGHTHYEIGSDRMDKITVYDVARSLSHINRFTGHSLEPYSVASHCLYVSDLLAIENHVALHGLLHDAAESVVQDLSWPLKQKLGPEGLAAYREIEAKAEEALYRDVFKLALPDDDTRHTVKSADWVAVATEKKFLLPPGDRQWDMLVHPPCASLKLHRGSTTEIADQWRRRFYSLYAAVKGHDYDNAYLYRGD